MAKKRSLPSPPPAPVESSEEEQFSSDSEEEEQQKTSILKNANPNANPRKDQGEDDEETEDPEEPEEEPEEEEDEESEEEEEEEEHEEEDATAAANKIPVPAASESESGSESDSDSDEPPRAIKPISSKPMPPEPIAVPYPAIRKTQKDGASAFQRVWSLEAEIALLNGILNYKDKTGTIPQNINSKSGRFADFPGLVRMSLGMDVSEIQLSEKIRRLKVKYEKAAARSSPHLANPHDRMTFELSEKIWSNGGAGEENVAVKNGEEGHAVGGYRFLGEAVAERKDFAATFVLEALERVDPLKARLLDEKYKKQKMAAMKLHLQKMELHKETFKVIMEGVDRSG